jgi:uncharacterized membrane protein (GlpM family)
MTLALKLVLTPVLIGGASLAGRRWGGAVSGWLVALPLTSGPVVAFLVAEHGAHFGARSAVGSLSGVAAEAAFCLAYSWSAVRGPAAATGAATAAFAAGAALVQSLPLSARFPLPLLAIAAGDALVLAAAAATLPTRAATASRSPAPPPPWDLAARAVVTTALVVLLTGAATLLGARLTGLLSVFPLYAAVLAVFAHVHDGRSGATAVLRGVAIGLYSFIAFFLVLAALLGRIASPAAFACACVAALATHSMSLASVLRAP